MKLPSHMRAVVWRGPGDLRVEDRPVPVTTPGTAIIKTALAGICATDHEVSIGRISGFDTGYVLGHEITGVVVSSDGTDDIQIGDRVVVDTAYSCQICENCIKGKYLKCLTPGELGFTADGGWAEYVKVDTQRLHKVPDHMSWEESVLSEPFACPLGALLDCGEDISGKYVLIVGGGLAAIAFASAAFALGASCVEVSLRTKRRSEIFQKIHPELQLSSTQDFREAVADISIDSVGNTTSIQTAIAGVKNQGLVICYGFNEDSVNNFPLTQVVLRNLRLSGHTNPSNVWPTLIEMLHKGSISTKGYVDEVVTIEEVPKVVANRGPHLRTVIQF